jgi:hypothetical protein
VLVVQDAEDVLPEEFNHMTAESISQRARLLDNEIRVSARQALNNAYQMRSQVL